MKEVKGYIERKSMLYVTGVAYGDYSMNYVLGCAHGCKYPCYAFLQKKRFGQVTSYEEWLEPYLVSNTLEILDKEIPNLRNKISSVQLCFTTDPFMYEYKEIEQMTLNVIEKLNKAGIKCTVLTKGLLPITLADYSKENEYGITIISLDETFREDIEPGAANYQERLRALHALHDKGCLTWVSLEPYPTPNLVKQDFDAILKAIAFTDKIIFGRMNYSKEINSFIAHRSFYNKLAEKVISFCQKKKIQFHIKDGTKVEIE
jgi:DNA repair photolyase